MTATQSPAYLGRPAGDWLELLQSDDPINRRLAVYALGELGPGAKDVAPRLAESLGDEESFVRVWAAAALVKVDPASVPAALSALSAGLSDDLYFVRSLAAWHLSRLPQDTPGLADLVPELEKLREDRDPSVCVEAAAALRRIQAQGGMLAH